MKVLSKGKRKIKCTRCMTKFEFEASDVKTGRFGVCHYGGDSGESRTYVDCPECGKTIFVKW